MANSDRPRGARPKGRVLRETEYTAGATVYPGDLVHLEADGLVDPAAASEACVGVAATYASASGEKVLVYDDPDQQFIIQADTGTTPAQTAVGLNYDVVATGGNTTYRQSRMELDSSSGATTSTLPLRLIGFSQEEGNEIGEHADCVVVINNHQLKGASEGL